VVVGVPVRWLQVNSGDVCLSVLELAGATTSAVPVVFVHGLAGHAREWLPLASTGLGIAGWALDQRGHGYSTRRPADVNPEVFVADLAAVISQVVDGRPACVVGQSMGGVVAIGVAARHPELVSGLVVIDASPARPSTERPEQVRAGLASWPRPFRSQDDAINFFGGGSRGRAWAAGLDRTPTGWWPRFDRDIMVRVVAAGRDSWAAWSAITCPTIVLRADHDSFISPDDVEHMRHTGPRPQIITVPGAGHDIHLDRPDSVRDAIQTIVGAHQQNTHT
jgi:pimeloyl-ACP methyl ester carboxylesterase